VGVRPPRATRFCCGCRRRHRSVRPRVRSDGGVPLALTGDQKIALVGVLVGLAGTIGGLLFAYFNGRAERAAAHKLARSGRLHAQRLDAYADLSAFLERERLYIERTEPQIVVGEGQAPPDPLSDEEWIKLRGRVSVGGSATVEAAVEEAQTRAHGFAGAVLSYRGIVQEGGNAIQVNQSREQMDRARRRAIEVIEDAQRVMRDELADL
jgi:hypothetical protein